MNPFDIIIVVKWWGLILAAVMLFCFATIVRNPKTFSSVLLAAWIVWILFAVLRLQVMR